MAANRKISDFFQPSALSSKPYHKPELQPCEEKITLKEKTTLGAHLPPYPDIGDKEINLNNDALKLTLLREKWTDCTEFSFPSREISNRTRRLSPKWLLEYDWLRYSVTDDSLYCAPCLLFGRKEAKEKLFINKVTDWSNLHCFIKRHIRDGSSHHTYQAMGADFVRIQSTEFKDESTLSKLSESRKAQVLKNRHVLMIIMEILLFSGKQNIAIRGHTPEKSNFMAVLNLKARDDPILSEHLEKENRRALYTSPDIQNEILNILGDQVQSSVVDGCNASKCFALIADETQDVSTREQLSVCVHYLVRDSCSKKVSAKEDFLDSIMATSTTGEQLHELLVQALENAGIDITKMRVQCYDGAANMSGRYKGVQARMCEVVPAAMYVQCKAHCLNLAIVHSCKDVYVRNVMATVQEVAFSFDYCAKKLQTYFEELESDATTKENMEKRKKLRTLCETRWTSRADSLYTFKASFPVVVHSLEKLQSEGDDKAGQYLASILRFEFVIALVVAEHVLQNTVQLSMLLQGTDCDLLEVIMETQDCYSPTAD